MNHLILIADDEPEIAEILDAYLRREGFRTACAGNGQAALDLHASLRPDLVLLDVRMPVRDGWDVLGELRRRGETPVIMVTALDQDFDKLQALRIGADDYIVKPFNPVEVVARARAILRRGTGVTDRGALRVGPVEVNIENYMAAVVTLEGRRRLDLTLTEFRILAHMARIPLRVFTRAELAEASGLGEDVQARTVDSHVSHLRRKLEAAGSGPILTNVRSVGYRLDPEN
jgi:two-component system response regulator AdeR